ncbi:MAG: hypothetical protein ACI30A_06695 [Paludibacteraceae bacterium]
MHRIFTYLITIILLCSCSAPKRLAHLLAMHPELQHTDTLYRDRYIHLPGQQNSITLTLDQLHQLDNDATKQAQTTTDTDNTPEIATGTSRSKATLHAQGNGILTLQSEALPDTIHIHDTIYQPSFVTHTQYKDRIIHKPNAFQSFFCYTGVIALLYLLIRIIISAIRK